MAEDQQLRPLLAVVGPTGSGKSALAIRLAQCFRGEIVNCDSLQLYRYLDIGTAKPPPGQMGGVPHHLFDLLDPDQVFTAGEYARAARPVLDEIAARGRLPIVVGGTGFYLRALLEGLCPGPPRSDRLRARLARRESLHPGWLHGLLARYDRASAARIHSADVQKLLRAVEVLLATREPLSAWFERGRDPIAGFRTLKLGLDPPRQALYERLDARLDGMFAGGLLDEVRSVLSLGFSGASKALEAHGYKQAIQVLNGTSPLKDAVILAKRNTRRYAKRQWTWFRRDPEVRWLHGFGDEPDLQRAALVAAASYIKPSPQGNNSSGMSSHQA
jgi:tRNA dimethylallyltransferase